MPAERSGTAEGAPPSWFVRVVFDMLLDPTIEDLVLVDPTMPMGAMRGTLRDTQPVTLRCNGVDIAYDGYYLPNGSRVSWPLGPDLFIQPLRTGDAPTGSTCQVGIKDVVVNKNGDQVPPDQRTFDFKIGPHVLRSTTPASNSPGLNNGSFEQDPAAPITLTFTAPLRTPLATTGILINEGPNIGDGPNPAVCTGGGTAVAAIKVDQTLPLAAATTALAMRIGVVTTPAAAYWNPGTTYFLRFAPGTKVPAGAGSVAGTPDGVVPDNLSFCFHTPAAM